MNLEIYQTVRSFLIKPGMKTEKKKHFERYIQFITENGFTKKYYRDMPIPNDVKKLEQIDGKADFVHYKDLRNYIEANTKVEALPFDKLGLPLPNLLGDHHSGSFYQPSHSLR